MGEDALEHVAMSTDDVATAGECTGVRSGQGAWQRKATGRPVSAASFTTSVSRCSVPTGRGSASL